MALLKMISKKLNRIFTSQDDGTIIEETLNLKPIIKEKPEEEEDDNNRTTGKEDNGSND